MFRYTRREVLERGLGVGILAVGSSLLRVHGVAKAAGESTFERAKREKVILIGFTNQAPYSFMKDGQLTGEAIVILQYILPKFGIEKIDSVLTEFRSLIPGLAAKRFDMIAAAMAINPARCEQIAFANPDHVVGSVFAVKKGNPKNLHSYKDVATKPTVIIGGLAGGAGILLAAEAGIPKERALVFPDVTTGFAALQAGRIDAFGASSISVQTTLRSVHDPNLELAIPFTDPVDQNGHPKVFHQGMGFRKEDNDFRRAYNVELAKIRASGKLLELIAPFGFSELNIPPLGLTAEQLCSRPK